MPNLNKPYIALVVLVLVYGLMVFCTQQEPAKQETKKTEKTKTPPPKTGIDGAIDQIVHALPKNVDKAEAEKTMRAFFDNLMAGKIQEMDTVTEFNRLIKSSTSDGVIAEEEATALYELLKSIKTPEEIKQENQDYIDKHLTLSDIRVRQDKIYGKITNKGSRTLNEVEITVYYLNAQGTRISEETHRPVDIDGFSLDSQSRVPLKPNYVREFEEYAIGAPEAWAKKVEVEITDIDFE